ncbi:hypothetical protein Q5P01_011798 [Channa striata]|uniref:Homocysteine-responsive endoplasmic reticulum-resident ubiquitin-like domain member 2 protein n=1 Tax=Channa striata TaxID=64152 RepID=A0AA88MVJ2_CHASR|nr:hypothetical protein Q5P01_011798 [Channa striata]
MKKECQDLVLKACGASALRVGATIQTLWSGYGEIVRLHLESCDRPSVVVKHVKFPEEAEHPGGWNTDRSHRRKVRSYQVETHWYQNYSTGQNCRIPACLAACSYGDEMLIVLEDLDAAGYDQRRTSVKDAEIKACLSWLAHFHALFMGVAPDGLWPVGTYWHLETRPDELEAMDDARLKAAAGDIDRLLNEGQFQTIVHGDAKLANFCFSESGLDVAAVDFQTTRRAEAGRAERGRVGETTVPAEKRGNPGSSDQERIPDTAGNHQQNGKDLRKFCPQAPNQKYEDQTINCFLNWTVERLKRHISNVYPSKPLSKDQRLVYSGKLLQDHVQLRDVLRKQDEYHMMHLVCTSHSPPGSPKPRVSSMANSSASNASSSDNSPATTPSQDSQTASQSSSSTSDPVNYDGLRYRSSFPQYDPQSPPGVPQWPEGAQVPLQGGFPANVPPHPMYVPMQMLWWQQLYARQYYMQYQAAVAASQPSSASLPSPSSPSTHQPAQANEAVQQPLGPNPAPNPLPENPPANPNIQMNAQGGAVLNDDEVNRDWLDWLYTVSRAGVLLSIVYFYSSFSRFVMVVGAMLLVYLHQAGWFPFRLEQQNPRGEEQARAPQEEADRHQDIQEMERLMDDGMEDDDSSEEGGGGAEDQAQAAAAAAHPN